MKAVELGFAEKCDKKIDLCSLFNPSKVGGRPAWLSFQGLPKPDQLECGNCKQQMVMLCQLYIPTTDGEGQPYHRTLYLFCCRQGPCSKQPSFVKVFRAQRPELPSEPNYDEYDDSELLELNNAAEKPHKLCNVCGCLGDKVCSSCHEVWYCCKQHQAIDWKLKHKKQCGNNNNISDKLANLYFDDDNTTKHPLFFDEYEIVIEEEPAAKPQRKTMAQVEKEYPDAMGPVTDKKMEKELAKLENKDVDEVFAEFRERIDREPEQIVRYQQGGTPLWVSKDCVPTDIPPCAACGAERRFEFQVLPQMINYLGVETTVDSIDFGTLCVYTCSRNCIEGETYKEEVVWKQDFS